MCYMCIVFSLECPTAAVAKSTERLVLEVVSLKLSMTGVYPVPMFAANRYFQKIYIQQAEGYQDFA